MSDPQLVDGNLMISASGFFLNRNTFLLKLYTGGQN